MRSFQVVLLIGSFGSLVGCADESPENNFVMNDDGEYDAIEMNVEADPKAVTKTYYISNPTASGCSSALKLTAKGSKITQIKPSGCEISCTACGTAPSWDTLTSAGASTLYDT